MTKRFLALTLCAVMILCSIGTITFATEENTVDIWDGTTDTEWYNEDDLEFTLTTSEELAGFAKLVDEGNDFDDKTIKLGNDIDLEAYEQDMDDNGDPLFGENGEPVMRKMSFDPIGYGYNIVFKGTFDGQGNTIKNLYQNGWNLGYSYGTHGGGLFASVVDAEIKNVNIDNAEIVMECVDMGALVGYSYGTCTYENITISNTVVANYNRYTGGVVGEVNGTQTFKNVDVDSTTTVSAIWGTPDAVLGGIIGGKWGDAAITMEECDVACTIDAFNDVVANYMYYNYRLSGMLIGMTEESTDGVATASFLDATNCTVTFDTWNQYTYCEFESNGQGSYNAPDEFKHSRVQEGYKTGGVDPNHTHSDVESHEEPLPFEQIFGGDKGVRGGKTHDGVTVIDKVKQEKMVAEVWAPATTARTAELVLVDSFETLEDALAAAENGYTVKLLKNIEVNSGLTIDSSITLDLNGYTIANKGAASFKFNENISVVNGTLDISGAAPGGEGIFKVGERNGSYTVGLDGVDIIGENYASAAGVFRLFNNSVLNISNAEITLKNDTSESGGVFKGYNKTETFNLQNVVMNLEGTQRIFANSKGTIDNLTLNAKNIGNHGFRNYSGTIKNSSIDIDGCETGINFRASTDSALKFIDTDITIKNANNDYNNAGVYLEGKDQLEKDADSTTRFSLFIVPTPTVGDQVSITFDYAGGTDEDGYVQRTYNYNLRDSINAPAGLVRDGFIFAGWDKEIPDAAYASETYTAQWVSYDDYKFRVVLTPVGGTEISANEIKIDPQGNFVVEVSIEDAIEDMPWNVTEVTLSYNKELFTWNKINDTVTEDANGNLVFKVYGADKVDGKVIKQLSFTAKATTDKTTYEGVFDVVKASVDTGWAANTINATLVDDANKGTAKVYIYYTFDVTVGDGVDAPYTADTITDYEGTIKNYDPEYNYDIIVDMDGNEDYDVDYNEATGEFVIDNGDIVGDFTIDAVRTGIKGIETDDVELYEYVAGKYVLVLLNADSSRTYAYNSALMYKTPQYDTVAGKKIHYGYLVKGDDFAADVNGSLNTDANKALALSKITLASGTNPSIAHIDTIGDVNGTGTVDVNDIQAVWNAYNVDSNDAPKVNENMALYLRADVVRDKKVNVTDLNAVIEMYDRGITGVQTVLATCDTDGTTYSIDGIVTAETIPAIGHNYVSAGFEGTGTAMAYVETCTNCGGTTNLPLSDIFTTLKVSNGQVWGTADVDTAEKLMIINKLDAAGKLCHGEGISATININADIDLAGYEWRAMNGQFITINGNDHTISNITATEGVSGKGGFISYGGGCRINNLTIENITAEGCQVGAFIGAGEGGSLTNCTLKGNVNLAWKQNYTSDYVEEYGAIGILVGCHANGGSYTVTINENAIINVDASDFHTLIDTVGYADTYAPYIQYTMGTSLTYDITDNR